MFHKIILGFISDINLLSYLAFVWLEAMASSLAYKLYSIVKTCLQKTLCSRNFQNMKLRLDFVKIWWYYHNSDLALNQILEKSNDPKMSFLAISEGLNFYFSKFEQLTNPKFTIIQSSESLKLPKLTFLDCLNLPKFNFM